MIDFLKRLYKKRSESDDPVLQQTWQIAGAARDNEKLKPLRDMLVSGFGVTEEYCDTRYAAFTLVFQAEPSDTWLDTSLLIQFGMSEEMVATATSDFEIAMMVKVFEDLVRPRAVNPYEAELDEAYQSRNKEPKLRKLPLEIGGIGVELGKDIFLPDGSYRRLFRWQDGHASVIEIDRDRFVGAILEEGWESFATPNWLKVVHDHEAGLLSQQFPLELGEGDQMELAGAYFTCSKTAINQGQETEEWMSLVASGLSLFKVRISASGTNTILLDQWLRELVAALNQLESESLGGSMHEEAQSDPTMRMMLKLGIKPNQESFLTLAYPDDEVTGEILANLPDFFFDLPKTDPNEDSLMIDEDSGEPIECPICGKMDECDHYLGIIDRSFLDVHGPLDEIFNQLVEVKREKEPDWDEDMDEFHSSLIDFLSNELNLEYEIGISPGGPGMTSSLICFYSNNVDKSLKEILGKFLRS